MSFSVAYLRHQLRLVVIVISTVLLHQSAFAQTVVLRVDGDIVSAGGDGSGWGTDAFKFLQDALAEAEDLLIIDPITPVHLWVAATDPTNPYRPDRDAANPDGTGDPNATFLLDFNNVTLLGGFLGNETDPDDRDPAVNITVLGGVFGGGCGDPDAGDCWDENNTPGCDDLCGGDPCPGCCELVCDIDPLCCPDLGVWDQTCATIANEVCPLPNPGTSQPYHVVTADGVDDSVRIDGFTITGGFANGGVGNDRGAGMFISDASPAVVRVTFGENRAPFHGGGAMHIEGTSDPLVVNTSFIANTGNEAGALHTETGSAGGTFVNCLFIGNFSNIEGGAINPGGGETLTFINCTFADNTVVSVAGGGAIFTESGAGPVILTNCILWGNLAGGDPNQINDDDAPVVIVTYSDVQGGWGGPMDMNIDEDPLFVDASSGNYRLMETSPCIDVGNPDDSIIPCDVFDLDGDNDACVDNPPGEMSEPTPDLDLVDRVLDGDDQGPCTVDMGSFEFLPGCEQDIDGNGKVGASDLLILLATWGPCPPPCPPTCPADFDGTCTVGASDLLSLLANWGWCGSCTAGSPPQSVQDCIDKFCCDPEDLPALTRCIELFGP